MTQCSCKLSVQERDGQIDWQSFEFCPLHAAAPELLAALEGLSKAVVTAVAAEPHIFLGKEIDDAQYQAIDAIKSAIGDRDPVQ